MLKSKKLLSYLIDRGKITTSEEIYHSTGVVALTTMTVSSIPAPKFISLFYNNLVIDILVIGISLTQVIAKCLCMATEPKTVFARNQ